MATHANPGKLVVLSKSHAHSRTPQITQKLLLQDEILGRQIRELASERKKIRDRIREALGHGAKCEPGLRSAAIITRHVLKVR
jgi:hypothetical protein